MATYTLTKTETGRKAAKYHYTVTDENGTIISERDSNKDYVACTINGQFYFGRLDLIGQGDHGKQIKMCAGWQQEYNRKKNKWEWVATDRSPIEPAPIAYLKS